MIQIYNRYVMTCDIKSYADCHGSIDFGETDGQLISQMYKKAGWQIVDHGLFGPTARHACPVCKEK